MEGPGVATKPWDFYSPSAIALIAIALEKFGSPVSSAISFHRKHPFHVK